MKSLIIGLILCFPLSAVASSADPVDPVAGVLDAFKAHNLVALGEGQHGNEQAAEFRLSLIQDPRFATIVNDIVVEFGDARYQDIIDRFVRGEEIPYSELKKVWQDTTQPSVSNDKPIYEEMFRAVRSVNSKLPKVAQIRVLLGDPPIDWSAIQNGSDYIAKVKRMDDYPVAIIQREVLDKNRKALIVYGDMHYLRKNLYWPLSDREKANKDFIAPVNSIVSLIERRTSSKVFSIWSETSIDLAKLEPSVAAWPIPSLEIIRGTALGKAPFSSYYPHEMIFFSKDQSGHIRSERVAADPVKSPQMQEEFDAILYLGPPATITQSKLSATLCSDSDYVKMRSRRLAIWAEMGMEGPDSLARECAWTTGNKPDIWRSQQQIK